MSIQSNAVKKTAVTALKGNYLSGIIAATVYVFALLVLYFCRDIITTVCGRTVTAIFYLAVIIFLIIPLTLGFVFFSTRLIFCGEANPLLLFNYFTDKKSYVRALKFSVPFMLRAVITGAVLFLPYAAVSMLSSGELFRLLGVQMPLWVPSLWGVSEVLKSLAAFVLIFIMLKYYLAPFLLAADTSMDPLEAMNFSRIIASRTRKDFIWLIFSFILYIIACLFMIPTIFILPYFAVSYAVHCRFAVAAYNKTADILNLPEVPTFKADISF